MFSCSLPWNQHTMFGYFWEICIHIYCAECYLFTNGIFLLLFISMCQHHQKFYKMLRLSVDKIDRNVKELLCNLIRLQIQVKQWVLHQAAYEFFFLCSIVLIFPYLQLFLSHLFQLFTPRWFTDTANVFSQYILIQLISSMGILATAVFQIDMVMLFNEFALFFLLWIVIIF